MNLLLLLSALLSALTGIGGSARQPQLAQAVAQEVARPKTATRAVLLARPVQALATVVDLAGAPRSAAWSLRAAEPVFAARRRE